ncbi:DNA polymerase II large subunit [Trichinella spiralis]|uniref:DNA polymerase II large subunit n=1 Tax=Trichinella spiralis TaxID=6334 RepID=A0ABR3K7Y1_TRISP
MKLFCTTSCVWRCEFEKEGLKVVVETMPMLKVKLNLLITVCAVGLGAQFQFYKQLGDQQRRRRIAALDQRILHGSLWCFVD